MVVTGVVALVFALRDGSSWVDRLRLGLTAVIGLQLVLGAITLIGGEQLTESLHLL